MTSTARTTRTTRRTINLDNWLPLREAMARLGVSKQRVYQLANGGKLRRWHPPIGRLRFSRVDIERYAHKQQARAWRATRAATTTAMREQDQGTPPSRLLDEWLSAREAAAHVHVCEDTIRGWAQRGEVQRRWLHGSQVFNRLDLDRHPRQWRPSSRHAAHPTD